MKTKLEIAKNWLTRYTGMPLSKFGNKILLTNFSKYVTSFSEIFGEPIYGLSCPMQACTNKNGVTIINFGIGSANAATIMDLLVSINPTAVLFLGKCGGVKKTSELGHFILPIAAIRGEGTSNDYMPSEVPAMPSFKLHKFVSEYLQKYNLEYRTGVIYTTNRRIWEWDEKFKEYLKKLTVIGIDMETATILITGHANHIPRGALLLVSDLPMTEEGIKTQESDKAVTAKFVLKHLEIGIEAMSNIDNIEKRGEKIKHFSF
jgi:AMP nucleosidase